MIDEGGCLIVARCAVRVEDVEQTAPVDTRRIHRADYFLRVIVHFEDVPSAYVSVEVYDFGFVDHGILEIRKTFTALGSARDKLRRRKRRERKVTDRSFQVPSFLLQIVT